MTDSPIHLTGQSILSRNKAPETFLAVDLRITDDRVVLWLRRYGAPEEDADVLMETSPDVLRHYRDIDDLVARLPLSVTVPKAS